MSFKIVGIGEVLWDLLPSGRQLGGALSASACVITRVPVKTGATSRRFELVIDGLVTHEFFIELADTVTPDFYSFLDLGDFQSKQALVRVDSAAAATSNLNSLVWSNSIIGANTFYQEANRPIYHVTARRGWLNDPNGLVFYEGEHHLFYQYNPYGDKWGHMSWGHAVSPDMVHWKHLPLALAEEDGAMIFSGSAVIDWKNSSGFGKDGQPPMVAIYTGYRTNDNLQFECIAFSNDKGRTWTKYSGNPVINLNSKDFRDPKVQWHEPTKKWIMTVSLSAEHKVCFYGSTNLKEWTLLSKFGPAGATGGVWECPDLFELPVPGTSEKRWVLAVNINPGSIAGGSGGQYFIGQFDGTRFVADKNMLGQSASEFVPEGKVIADFEGDTYGDWKTTGDAFGSGPAKGKFPNQNPVDGYKGERLVNSFFNGDQTTGTLTSPEFAVAKPFLNFLIGGGSQKETRMDLWVDGKVVRTASGEDGERLAWRAWDVRELIGRQAKLEIVDNATGGWGTSTLIKSCSPMRPRAPLPKRRCGLITARIITRRFTRNEQREFSVDGRGGN